MEQTLTALASDLLARLPTMTGEEQRLGLEIYRQLSYGEPVLRAGLAEALEVPTPTVDELLEHPNLKWLTYTDREGRSSVLVASPSGRCRTGSKSTAGRCTPGARGTVSSSPASSAWRPTWNRLRPEAPLAFG